MNSVADGIVLLDPEGTITWLSRSAEAIFDYPRDAAIGARSTCFLAASAGEPAQALLERLRRRGRAGRRCELTIRRRSGELIAGRGRGQRRSSSASGA